MLWIDFSPKQYHVDFVTALKRTRNTNHGRIGMNPKGFHCPTSSQLDPAHVMTVGFPLVHETSLFWHCLFPFHSAMVGSWDPPLAKYSSVRRWSDRPGTCYSGVSIGPLPSLFWRCLLPFHSAMVGSWDPPLAKYSSVRRWFDRPGTCYRGVSIA